MESIKITEKHIGNVIKEYKELKYLYQKELEDISDIEEELEFLFKLNNYSEEDIIKILYKKGLNSMEIRDFLKVSREDVESKLTKLKYKII